LDEELADKAPAVEELEFVVTIEIPFH